MNLKSGSRLEKLLAGGQFVVTGELGPPKGSSVAAVEEKAEHLLGKVDSVNITDNQTAIVRMSSIAAGKVALDMGLEPNIQMTCRDRNRIAIQADIFGAYAMGLRNLLCLTGDHQIFGNHPQAKNVFDLDSIQLIDMIRKLRDENKVLGGDECEENPKMFIGAAENPFGTPLEFRARRLAKKVAAGVDFIQTQCIYDMKVFKDWMKEVVDLGLHEKCYILAGVTPLKSAGMANYMAKKVAGITIPDEILQRMKGVAKENAAEEGIKICLDQIEEFRQMEGIAGIHLMAIEWEHRVPEIMERAGLLPRPEPAD